MGWPGCGLDVRPRRSAIALRNWRFRLHSVAQDAVDFDLVLLVAASESVEDIGVEADADGFLADFVEAVGG